MSQIYQWLLSIIGVVFIGLLINLVLPDSHISKYIKGIYSFFIIFVILNPIINSINSKDFCIDYSINIDENFLQKTSEDRVSYYENSIITKARLSGIRDLEVKCLSHLEENKLILDKVFVYLQSAVIDEELQHIDKYQVLTDIITSITKINKENIIYYE